MAYKKEVRSPLCPAVSILLAPFGARRDPADSRQRRCCRRWRTRPLECRFVTPFALGGPIETAPTAWSAYSWSCPASHGKAPSVMTLLASVST